MLRRSLLAWAAPSVLVIGCAADPPATSPPGGPRLAIAVAPLDLPGVVDACYTLTVHNGAAAALAGSDVVWSRAGVCAERYGDGAGGVAYVGTCDASPEGRTNTVSLVLDGLCRAEGCDVDDPGDADTLPTSDYQNPCPASAPCRLERPCREGVDTAVDFELTVMRRATQGFFDLAVAFDDVFCSAKLDCVDAMLHDPSGARGPTAVLAFACTAGVGASTCLYADPVTLSCDNGSWTLDPTAGPGNVPESSPLLFGAAVYRGDEDFAGLEKSYWNIALGLDPTAFAAAQNCTLSWTTSAAEGALPGMTTPAGAWPALTWSRDLLVDGVLACTSHPLDVNLPGESAPSVATTYLPFGAPHTFAHELCRGGAVASSGPCPCPSGYAPTPEEDKCVATATTAPTASATTYAVCPSVSVTSYGDQGARFHAGPPSLLQQWFLEPCTDPAVCVDVPAPSSWVGYLNTIGIWTCEPEDSFGVPPYDQWIGFSQCLDLDVAGDYLVGIAGDNQVRLRVDGADVYTSSWDENFRQWHVFPISLGSGAHVVELYGANGGGPGAFGAEIVGPFAPGAIATPTLAAAAPYGPANTVFSTRDLRSGGATFQTSLGGATPSGLTCPEGAALDLCTGPPQCVTFAVAACGDTGP